MIPKYYATGSPLHTHMCIRTYGYSNLRLCLLISPPLLISLSWCLSMNPNSLTKRHVFNAVNGRTRSIHKALLVPSGIWRFVGKENTQGWLSSKPATICFIECHFYLKKIDNLRMLVLGVSGRHFPIMSYECLLFEGKSNFDCWHNLNFSQDLDFQTTHAHHREHFSFVLLRRFWVVLKNRVGAGTVK